MLTIDTKVKNAKIDIEQVTGFLSGLNTFQDQTVIKDSELTEAKNVILSVDGIEPRFGTYRFGDDGGGDGITFVGSNQNGASSGTAISVNKPSGTQAGDVAICFINVNGTNDITDNNGGDAFTDTLPDRPYNSSSGQVGIWIRVLDGTEGSTFDFTAAGSDRWAIIVEVYRNVHSDIWDVAPSASTENTGTGASNTTSALTTLNNGALIITFAVNDSDTLTFTGTPSGYTVRENNSGEQLIAVADKEQATAGTQSAVTWTQSASNGTWLNNIFSLKPAAADDKVYGSTAFYKSNGTTQYLRVANQRLQKLVGTTWTDVDSTVFADANTEFVQAYDEVYIFNGSDNLRVYDGSTISSYSAISAPSTSLSVTPQGTTGSTNYSYIVTAFNAQGETLGSTQIQTSTGNATLDATNYNLVSWGAVGSATGYNVYGRTATGLGETYMATVYTNSYSDKGQDSPSTTVLPPEGNSTAGIIGTMAVYAISRIFVAGDPDNPSRLYWGGLGTHVGNFSGALEGGGYADVYKNDGSQIRAIKPFQDGVIVWKDNAIYKFSFTSDGFPQLEEITRSFGGISHRSVKHVENDIIFASKKDGRLAFYSLGYQENYSASILRTNELSVKVASKLEDVNISLLNESAAFYFRNIYGCAVPKTSATGNNRIWCLDTRFGAWVYWEDLQPNHFSVYDDSTNGERLFFGDENSPYMVEMFKTERNDDGSPIATAWTTKAFDQDLFRKYKQYFRPTFQFKNISKSGGISGDIIVDGAITEKSFSVSNVSTNGLGVGVMLPGQFLPGEAYGGTASEGESADQLIEINTPSLKGRSVKYAFRTQTTDLRYKFLSLAHEYRLLPSQPLSQTSRVY